MLLREKNISGRAGSLLSLPLYLLLSLGVVDKRGGVENNRLQTRIHILFVVGGSNATDILESPYKVGIVVEATLICHFRKTYVRISV